MRRSNRLLHVLYKKAGFKKNPAKTNGGIDKENPKHDFNVLDYDSIF
jgi:hypothetical protein